jgi:hypothetical protein
MSRQAAGAQASGGVDITNFLALKYQELFEWCYQEGSKVDSFMEDVQARLPKYYEAIIGCVKRMAAESEQESYRGIEEAQGRAKNLFARAIERLKELKRTQA